MTSRVPRVQEVGPGRAPPGASCRGTVVVRNSSASRLPVPGAMTRTSRSPLGPAAAAGVRPCQARPGHEREQVSARRRQRPERGQHRVPFGDLVGDVGSGRAAGLSPGPQLGCDGALPDRGAKLIGGHVPGHAEQPWQLGLGDVGQLAPGGQVHLADDLLGQLPAGVADREGIDTRPGALIQAGESLHRILVGHAITPSCAVLGSCISHQEVSGSGHFLPGRPPPFLTGSAALGAGEKPGRPRGNTGPRSKVEPPRVKFC
jgi:hypothetical protein